MCRRAGLDIGAAAGSVGNRRIAARQGRVRPNPECLYAAGYMDQYADCDQREQRGEQTVFRQILPTFPENECFERPHDLTQTQSRLYGWDTTMISFVMNLLQL
jgi:hypothetical protein